jgi:hypothetical protein
LFCYGDVAFAEICAFDLDRWPNVAKWARRVMQLPAFKAPFELLAMEDAELSYTARRWCLIVAGERIPLRETDNPF